MRVWLMAMTLCVGHMATGLDWTTPGLPNVAFGLASFALLMAWLEELL